MNRSAVVAAALPLALGLALPAPAQAATTTTVTASVSTSTITLGSTASVTGTASGPTGRTVRLEARIASGWKGLATTTTSSTGRYTFSAPAQWLGAHRLRVVAVATGASGTGASADRAFTVSPSWSPAGSSSSWSWLSSSHPRYNPCRTITWKFNPSGGYSGALSDVTYAFKRVAQATGLTFSYEGTTAASPRQTSSDRSVAITVGFVSTLAKGVAGQGGGTWTTHDGQAEMLRGTLALNRYTRLRTGFATSGDPTWGQIMEHELGHVLGLGHSGASSQLMYGTASYRNHRLGAGDLSGLRAVGLAAGCIPNAKRTV